MIVKMVTTLFIACLLLICSVPSSAKSISKKKQPSVPHPTPFEGEAVNFVLDLTVEPASDDGIFRDSEKKDFFGLQGNLRNQESYSDNLAKNILNFIKINGLEDFLSSKSFGFATANFNGESLSFFESVANKVFNPEGSKEKDLKLSSKILHKQLETSISLALETGNTLDFYLLSHGYFRKMHGLNLIPQVCPHLREEMEAQWDDTNRFKTWIVIKNLYNFTTELSNDMTKKTFYASTDSTTWLFDGAERSLSNKPKDFYKFLVTAYYDSQFKSDLPEMPNDIWNTINEARNEFFKEYLPKDLTEFVGQRFFHYLTYIINQRSSLRGQPLKKWITIGVSDIPLNILSRFISKTFNLNTGSPFEIGQSLYLVFTGINSEDINHVWLYRGENKIGPISIKDLLSKLSKMDITKTEDFNNICIGKEKVESIAKDY